MSSSIPGYHPTYLLLHLMDSEPVEVVAMLSRHRLAFMEGEDSAHVAVRFADGSVGTITTSWAYEPAGCTERFSVVGEAGSLWTDGDVLFHQLRGGAVTQLTEPPAADLKTVGLSVLDFVACVREGRRPIDTEVEGIQVLGVDPRSLRIGGTTADGLPVRAGRNRSSRSANGSAPSSHGPESCHSIHRADREALAGDDRACAAGRRERGASGSFLAVQDAAQGWAIAGSYSAANR